MHFEILVEDASGGKAIELLLPKIIDVQYTTKIISYRGIGRIPGKLGATGDASHRVLLQRLPQILRGYGKAFRGYNGAVIVVCDLDNKCLKTFRQELLSVLEMCNPAPITRFCIAVEEMEAWLLGDLEAIQSAFPKAKKPTLNKYKNDSICGTWELLADAIIPRGSSNLLKKGYHLIGKEKHQWAESIVPHMNVEINKSPSFQYFREKIRELANSENA